MSNSCTTLQKSLGHCQGKPVLPGIKRRVYYQNISNILKWPTLAVDELGRPTTAIYSGDFTLAEGAKWLYADHLPGKAEFKAETQGEYPSQTIKETVSLTLPDVSSDTAEASAFLLNTNNVFLVEDMAGNFRVVGSKYYDTTTTYARDNGQGATGTAGTTIAVEAVDIVDCPYYTGKIETEDGVINEA
jgi:hypothetical protein